MWDVKILTIQKCVCVCVCVWERETCIGITSVPKKVRLNWEAKKLVLLYPSIYSETGYLVIVWGFSSCWKMINYIPWFDSLLFTIYDRRMLLYLKITSVCHFLLLSQQHKFKERLLVTFSNVCTICSLWGLYHNFFWGTVWTVDQGVSNYKLALTLYGYIKNTLLIWMVLCS
jgi:hypothetical protein